MRLFRTVVVAVLLGSFFSPALASAKTESGVSPAEARPLAAATLTLARAAAVAAVTAQAGEAQQYAQREQQSQQQGVQDFKGGAVYVYFGSGVVLALIIIILILL
jgi:Neuraminidase (sialidase)